MQYFGDYHTHTVYSHGKGTIEQNAEQAQEIGLTELGITDHGLNHVAFGLRRGKLQEMRRKIDRLNEGMKVRVLMGVEANLIGADGWVDVKEKDLPYFDLLLCGFHKVVWAKTLRDNLRYFSYNTFHNFFRFEVSESVKRRNTRAYVRAIQRYPIDVITHIGHDMTVDCKEVAKAARDYGTFVEINGKRISFTDEEFMAMYDTGVNFIVDSDAHTVDRVGEVSVAQAVIDRLKPDRKRIVNAVGNPPVEFRSRKR